MKFSLTESVLKLLARWAVYKYQPGVIGITGSIGKTSTKEAIAVVLKNMRELRASRGNFNSQKGLLFTILGDWPEDQIKLFSRAYPAGANVLKKIGFVIKVIFVSLGNLIFGLQSGYPEILVLEYGADKPGDIKELLEIARPQIAVVTAIGAIPAHIEFYPSAQAVAREKARLIENLPANGFAVLNADDESVIDLKDRTRAHVLTFGFGREAEVRITNFEHRFENNRLVGVAFKLEYGGSFVPVKIDGSLSKAVAYAAAAAACVGIVFGMNLVKIAEALQTFQSPPHRMKIVLGIKNTTIVDDSYNASPASMALAIETIKSISASRKVGILGDMLEIGKYALEAHEKSGAAAAQVFDFLITVGPHGRIMAEAARSANLAKKKIVEFDSADAAALKLPELLHQDDLVLIKASRAIRLDKLVEVIRQV